jgi:hypothetical protein
MESYFRALTPDVKMRVVQVRNVGREGSRFAGVACKIEVRIIHRIRHLCRTPLYRVRILNCQCILSTSELLIKSIPVQRQRESSEIIEKLPFANIGHRPSQ